MRCGNEDADVYAARLYGYGVRVIHMDLIDLSRTMVRRAARGCTYLGDIARCTHKTPTIPHPCGQAPDGPGDGRVMGVIAPAEGLTEKMKQQRQMPSPDGRCPPRRGRGFVPVGRNPCRMCGLVPECAEDYTDGTFILLPE
jgi:hypothetical protein